MSPRLVLAALATVGDVPVLDTAFRIAEMTGSGVEAVHVGELVSADDAGAADRDLTAGRGVPVRRLTGPVEQALLGAIDVPDVVVAAIGTRTTATGRRAFGRTARSVLEHAKKPVVVPPSGEAGRGRVERVLVPLEGTLDSSRPVLDALCPLLASHVELVVLHVFTEKTLPRMLDRPRRDLELLGQEFLATHCPPATRIELRPGPVPARVSEVSEQHGADLVVLSWAQDASPGRARIVREVLETCPLAVLLLPLSP
jgi:nucleotide-binding universal stress UspA family protein